MVSRIVVFAVLVAAARAGVPLEYHHGYAAPVALAPEPHAPAHYDFGYSVNDPLTGDSKSQQETRRGDIVQGSYSLIDADGTKRTVHYAADPHNGFNAVVSKEPLVVKAVAPVARIAPHPVAHVARIAPHPVAHVAAYPHNYFH